MMITTVGIPLQNDCAETNMRKRQIFFSFALSGEAVTSNSVQFDAVEQIKEEINALICDEVGDTYVFYSVHRSANSEATMDLRHLNLCQLRRLGDDKVAAVFF